jgi:hypothetical protein
VGFEGRKVSGGSVLGKRGMRLEMEMGIGRMPVVDADREDVRAGSNSVKERHGRGEKGVADQGANPMYVPLVNMKSTRQV